VETIPTKRGNAAALGATAPDAFRGLRRGFRRRWHRGSAGEDFSEAFVAAK
jgi:hypothetical protein